MQLNKFTDYALRVLMSIAKPSTTPYTIARLATDLHVSQNHLVKIVHFMAKQQWIITTRGKGGGIQLHPEVLQRPLGQLVRILQGQAPIVDCSSPECILRPECGLKAILDQAVEQFYQHLDQYCLQQLVQKSPPTHENSITLLQL